MPEATVLVEPAAVDTETTVETEPLKVSVDVPEATVLVDPAAVDTETTVLPGAVETEVLVT